MVIMAQQFENHSLIDSEEEIAYPQSIGMKISSAEFHQSMINKLSPCYSSQSTDLEKDTAKEVVDDALLMKAGVYQDSSSGCLSVKIPSETSTNSSRNIGQRIIYWKNYLKEHAKITENLARRTGKKPSELLINRNEEHRRVQQCKTVLDVADRLDPIKLASRKPVTLKNLPCVPDVYETLPLQERLAKPTFTIIEKPKIALQEIGLEELPIHKSSWLHSEYFREQIVWEKSKLERVLDHYPDAERLQVVGTKILPSLSKKSACEKKGNADHVDFRIMDAWYRPKEPSLEYVIAIDGKEFDAENKYKDNVNLSFTFQCKPFEHQIRKLNIRNKGWKAVDVGWARIPERGFRCSPQSQEVIPAFYFNKNLTRIQPGSSVNFEFVFCCKLFGVYEELWELKLVPEFLAQKYKMVVSLFGQCFVDENDRDEFMKIDHNLSDRAAEQIAKELLNDVTTYAAHDPPIPKPYAMHFTQQELFNSINPHLNYNEDSVEQLKDMFFQLVLNNYFIACKEWRYDLKELKDIILSIPNETERKEFYERFNMIVNDMKVNSIVFSPNYEHQKILLVRNVLKSIAESIDKVVHILSEAIFYISYDLDFNEVLATNARLKCGKDDDDNSISVCVVKSQSIREKKQQAFNDALYVHTYSLVSTAIEQIVSILEGMKLL